MNAVKTFFSKFYATLSKRERFGFWFLTGVNTFFFLVMLLFSTGGFGAFAFFLLTQVILVAYYHYINKLERKSQSREWIDAIAFAVVAASLIRGVFLEAYTIPTPSMEKSLLVGDFLFVSKYHYGPRLPMTPLSVPFTHNQLPTGGKSYSEAIKLPYFRFPGFTKIKNNDVVVFNYPADQGRPVDKKDNYIKRCIGIPGDTITIVQGQVFINGRANENPPLMQSRHIVKTRNGEELSPKVLRQMDITEGGRLASNQGDYEMLLSSKSREELKTLSNIQSVEAVWQDKNEPATDYIFPYSKVLGWNVDNFGPLYIPKEGDVIQLNSTNYPIYERAIREYENNPTLEMREGKIFLEGKEITSYQFKMNYYFMMGDNRHNSADSRFWGFVPEDHIVGKAVLIWMSWDSSESSFFKRIRWNRLLNLIH